MELSPIFGFSGLLQPSFLQKSGLSPPYGSDGMVYFLYYFFSFYICILFPFLYILAICFITFHYLLPFLKGYRLEKGYNVPLSVFPFIYIYYIKMKFCLSGLYRLGNYINFVGALNEAVVGFESTHLDGYDLLVWCLSPLGYAGLMNNELELLLLNMPLSFASFFFNVILRWLYILFIFLLSLLRCLILLRFDFGLIDLFAS